MSSEITKVPRRPIVAPSPIPAPLVRPPPARPAEARAPELAALAPAVANRFEVARALNQAAAERAKIDREIDQDQALIETMSTSVWARQQEILKLAGEAELLGRREATLTGQLEEATRRRSSIGGALVAWVTEGNAPRSRMRAELGDVRELKAAIEARRDGLRRGVEAFGTSMATKWEQLTKLGRLRDQVQTLRADAQRSWTGAGGLASKIELDVRQGREVLRTLASERALLLEMKVECLGARSSLAGALAALDQSLIGLEREVRAVEASIAISATELFLRAAGDPAATSASAPKIEALVSSGGGRSLERQIREIGDALTAEGPVDPAALKRALDRVLGALRG